MRESMFENLVDIKNRQKEIANDENRICQRCETTFNVSRRRQNTMYNYDEGEVGDKNDPNFVTLCEDCHKENDEYWEERWQEYYSGLL